MMKTTEIEMMVRSLSGDAFEKMVPAIAYSTMAQFAVAVILMACFTITLIAAIYGMEKYKGDGDVDGLINMICTGTAVVSAAALLVCTLVFVSLMPYAWLAIDNPEALTVIKLMEKF